MHASRQESGYSIRETSSRHTTCESKYGRTPKAKKRLSPGIDPSSCSLCFTFNAAILWALFPSISNLVQNWIRFPRSGWESSWGGFAPSWRSTLMRYPALPRSALLTASPNLQRAASGAIYCRALAGGAVNSPVLCRVPRGTPALLQRPSDRAIGRAIGLSVCELIAARVQLAGNCALVGFPAKFLVE